MASATMMGLRRRAPVNNSPTPSSQSPSATTTTASSSKRSRSENNNSPSHGNLNSMNGGGGGGGSNSSGNNNSSSGNNNSAGSSNGGGSRDEPPTKKSRGTSTNGAKGSSSCSSTSSSSGFSSSSASAACSSSVSSSTTSATTEGQQTSKSRGTSVSRSATQTKSSSTSTAASSAATSSAADISNSSVLATTSWPTTPDMPSYASVTGLGLTGGQTAAGLCPGSLGMPPTPPISYMATSMATFVGTATNLGKSSSVSYLDISNMTGGSLSAGGAGNSLNGGGGGYAGSSETGVDAKNGIAMSYAGMPSPSVNGGGSYVQKGQTPSSHEGGGGAAAAASPRKFQNDAMFCAYQPWVIKTYGDLAKTKTITIKKYARILRTLRGEEVNSAENSKFRFWVKSKGFHIGQPEGYDAKPADRIIGRHAVTSPGLDPPLYVPTQLPHNKTLNGAEGTVPPGRVYKKVAIVENFFDIIHAVHVDLEGRPGKHAGQKRTYRTITETYAFLPREAVTRFLLGCTECQRRPRTPSPTNLSSQSSSAASSATLASTATPLSPSGGAILATSSVQNSPKPRDGSHHHAASSEGKNLHSYRHQKQHKNGVVAADKLDKDKDEKYNPLSITNLLKKEPVNGGFLTSSDSLPESRRTPESDRASSKSSASSKRKRMLPEGRTPSPQPSQPLPRPWSPGLDPKNTPIDYSLPITTSYLKHQQRLRQAEKSKAAANALRETETEPKVAAAAVVAAAAAAAAVATPLVDEMENAERERFSPATGLIDTNLNLLATIQHLHCQVMLALTERLRPSIAVPSPLVLPPTPANVLTGSMMMGTEVSVQTGENHS